MTTRNQLFVAGAIVLMAVIANARAWQFTRRESEAATPRHLHFAEHAVSDFDLDWRERTEVDLHLGEQPVGGGLVLKGSLRIRTIGQAAQGFMLGVSLTSLVHHELIVQGTSVLPTQQLAEQLLLHREAVVALTSSGAVEGVYFDASAPLPFRDLMTALIGRIEIVQPLQPAERWTGSMRMPSATVKIAYMRAGNPGTFIREHVGLSELRLLPSTLAHTAQAAVTGRGYFRLDDGGTLISLSDDDVITIPNTARAESSIRLTLTDKHTRATEPLPQLARLTRRTPGQAEPVLDRAHRADESLARGETEDAVASVVATYRGGGLAHGTMTKSAAFLRLHPEACARLVALFEAASTDPRARQLALDMVAAAGSSAAQAALRKMLSAEVARGDTQYAIMLARFGFVRGADAKSLEFVAKLARDADDHATREAGALALGAMITHTGADGTAYAHELRERLSGAKKPDDRAMLVAAIGNIQDRADVALLARYAADAASEVRASAAIALGVQRDYDASQALLQLAADHNNTVAMLAARGLSARGDDAQLLDQLARAVSAGKTNPAADLALIKGLSPQLVPNGPVHRMYLAIQARTEPDSELAAVLNTRLQGFPSL